MSQEKKVIRLLVADDHPLIRRALEMAVATEKDIEMVGMVQDGAETQQLVAQIKPDVLIVDLLMPNGGVKNIITLHQLYPQLKILVFTSIMEGETIREVIEAGAMGYLTKESDYGDLLAAIRAVNNGQSYLPRDVTTQLIMSIHETKQQSDIDELTAVTLTSRESDVFFLLGDDLSNKEISDKLDISDITVRVHLYNITRKYNFSSRAEIATLAIKKKLLREG